LVQSGDSLGERGFDRRACVGGLCHGVSGEFVRA
jgi:hypothetical protein